MAFKLIQESGLDHPILMCDVCGNRIMDMWSDLVSGSRGGNLVIHHKTCPTTESLHTTVIKFLGMWLTRSRIGDVASDSIVEKVSLEIPIGENLE